MARASSKAKPTDVAKTSPGSLRLRSAVGFRVKSGWATAVLLAGPAQSPQVLDRRVIELCDPEVPDTRQPYHARAGTLEEDEAKIKRRVTLIRRATKKSVATLLKRCSDEGLHVRGAGLVVGSVINPATIGNTHIRAHALEGRLFRTVLEEALRSNGVASSVIVERNAYAQAAEILSLPEVELKREVSALGRSLDSPLRLRSGPAWRADEKLAALAAWMVLGGSPLC